MLLLVYVLLSLYMALVSLSFPVYDKVTQLLQTHAIPTYQEILLLSGFSLNLLLTFTISLFFKFHVKLVLSNSTTIDNMDKKNVQKSNVYDKGSILNWYQVFGRNKALWLLPITGISGKPIGDGVIWTQENQNLDEDVPGNEVDVRKSVPENGNESSKNGNIRATNSEMKQKEDGETKPSTDSFRKGNNPHNLRSK